MKEVKPKPKKLGDLPLRALMNALGALILAFFIFFAEFALFRPIFSAGFAAIIAIALWEFYQLVKKRDIHPATIVGIVGAIIYVFAVFFKMGGSFRFLGSLWQHLPEIILALTFFACFVYFARHPKNAIVNIATTFLGVVYIVIPLSLTLNIVYFFINRLGVDPLFQGSWWLFYLIAVTKSADMGGYFIGRSFGRMKLASSLSPNKTLEGGIGGVISSITMSFLIFYLGKRWGSVFSDLKYQAALWLGLIIGVLGQMGDLAESLLKRDVDIKDSNTIPGVGGILDMVDSLIFTTPFLFIFMKIHYLNVL